MEQQLAELTQYLTENMATKADIQSVRDQMATKADLQNTRDEIMMAIATKSDKSDISELKEMIQNLDERTDQDIRAVIKDVAQLKNQ